MPPLLTNRHIQFDLSYRDASITNIQFAYPIEMPPSLREFTTGLMFAEDTDA